MSKTQFQASLNQMPACALVGQGKGINPTIYAIPNCQANESLTIGNFVWEDKEDSADTLRISASSDGTNIKPLGILAHTGGYTNTDLSLSASISVSSGQFVDVIRKGDIYVRATTSASRNDKVFANIYDGSIEIAEAGSELEEAVETDFSVLVGGEAGSIITISNWL